MIQETRDIRTLLAHQCDQSSAVPDFLGRTPATPKEIADVIHQPHEPSHRQLRRIERDQRGRL